MNDLRSIASQFQIGGSISDIRPFGSGHINDSYVVIVEADERPVRYFLQRINHAIFRDPSALMENVDRVTRHIRSKLLDRGVVEIERRVLSVIPMLSNRLLLKSEDGNYWRLFSYIERARSFDVIEKPEQAYQAAKMFGQFQSLLVDLPAPRLTETIPDFHHTVARYAALDQAIQADRCNRALSAKNEIDFALKHGEIAPVLLRYLESGEIPERTTHNDTKINNVLLDEKTGEGLCVIDLDTVMPGLSLYDFGDLIRTSVCRAGEDETDLSRIEVDLTLFEAIARGYLEEAGKFLNARERSLLVFSGILITFEQGIRFLMDYIQGDIYYKTHRERHNLDRCRTQFELVRQFLILQERMEKIVRQF